MIDNIVFELQGMGGVSSVWSSIIDELNIADIKCALVENSVARKNGFYKKLDSELLFNESGPLIWRRYRDVNVGRDISLFHSSYFRVHASKHVKNILTIHDFIYEKYESGIKKYIHLHQKQHALNKADRIICVSQNTKNDLLEYHPWVDPEIVSVIHNGYSNDFFRIVENHIPSLDDRPWLVYVGGRNVHKNFQAALQLLTSQTAVEMNMNLKVVGGGAFSAAEKGMIRDLKLSNKVHHCSGIDNKSLNILYNNAYALIYPSFYEGFGIPPLEAMAAGCPVICSNVSSIPEVVGNAGLMFSPHTPEEAERYLVKLQDSEYRACVIKRGLLRSSKFSWKKTGSETVNLYKELL